MSTAPFRLYRQNMIGLWKEPRLAALGYREAAELRVARLSQKRLGAAK
jgi:hypothetical protein